MYSINLCIAQALTQMRVCGLKTAKINYEKVTVRKFLVRPLRCFNKKKTPAYFNT